MTTLELEKTKNPAQTQETPREQEIDREELCQKLCTNIIESLLEGYNDLKAKNPDKEQEFLAKIEDLQKQLHHNIFNV